MGEPRIENITVSVRVRPLNPRELSSGGDTIWLSDSQSTIKEKAGARSFSFDRVYSESISTIEIFSYQGIPVLQKCLDGFNGCIFCYGQTGSGKTHTMHGVRKTNPGIAPLAIEEIFSMIQLSRGKEFLVRCSYIELYNESINDLLNPNLLNLQLAEDKKSGIKIIGVTEEVCTSAHQVFTLLQMGEKHKNVASTNYNQRSSRAHCIFRLIVESKAASGRTDVNIAALNLIDLAGSESADVHGPAASSARSKEMKYINRSLLTLGTVIMRLSDKKNNNPIPYRDSKLTRLLQPALEGDSKVSIICNISPCSDAYDETLSTLKFAQRAKKIKQTIVKNDTSDSKALILKYEREIQELQDKLREMESKLVQEEKIASDIVVSTKIMQLQEEKEKADAKLDRILQEKLQLSEDLERLKSFIILADDIKPTKLNDAGGKNSNKTGSAVVEEKKRSDTRSNTYNSPDKNENNEIFESPRFRRQDLDKNESLLIDGVEDIENFFKEELVKPVPDPTENISIQDCLKIIDHQAKQIEDLSKVKSADLDAKDKMIQELLKIIETRDEKILELEDELKLCRNNLTRMQILHRNQKEKK